MWMKFWTLSAKTAALIVLTASVIAPNSSGVVTIQAANDAFATDHLGNVYASRTNTITKYNSNGQQTGVFTKSRYDMFHDVDPSDPFKVLLFNKTSAEILRLDNKMAMHGEPLSLFSLGLPNPTNVCNSWDDGVWIYDQSLHELIRINNQGMIDQRSGNLGQLMPENTEISMIREKNFLLYVAAPAKGLFVFDRYANHIRTIPEKGIRSFQAMSNMIIFCRKGEVHSLHTRTAQTKVLHVPGNTNKCLDARIEGRLIFIRTKDAISIHPHNFNL